MLDSSLRRRALFAVGGAVAGSIALTGNRAAASPAASSAAASLAAAEPRPETPRAALHALLDGNRRFVAGRARHPRQGPDRIREIAAGQDPFAVILGCADSRVAPELLFD